MRNGGNNEVKEKELRRKNRSSEDGEEGGKVGREGGRGERASGEGRWGWGSRAKHVWRKGFEPCR